MKKARLLICSLCAVSFLAGCTFNKGTQHHTIRVSNYGHTKSRFLSLQNAVDKYNEEHPETQYSLEFNHYMDGIWDWDSYNEMIEELLQNSDQADLITMPGEYIGKLAAEGYFLPLDDIIQRSEYQEEYFAPLIPKTQFQGHTVGLLVETDVRTAYINKAVLEQLGYSGEEIEQIPEKIRMGEITLADLEEIGQTAVEKGLCDFSIVHRPKYGIYFYMMAQQFKAFSINEDGTINFNEENFADMLSFFQRNAVISKSPQPEEWSDTNDIFIQGRAAVYFGANWTIYDCIMERKGEEEKLIDQYVVGLIPAVNEGGTPFTISNTMLIAASNKCKEPEAVKEILANAYSDWDSLAEHASQSYRLPVSKSEATSPNFLKNTFESNLMYMMDYTSYMPYLKDNQRWLEALYQAVRSVENGSGTPQEVAHTFALDLQEEGTFSGNLPPSALTNSE